MRRYSILNLTDLVLGLNDLFTKRHAALVSTDAGKGQVVVLELQRKEIIAHPPADL